MRPLALALALLGGCAHAGKLKSAPLPPTATSAVFDVVMNGMPLGFEEVAVGQEGIRSHVSMARAGIDFTAETRLDPDGEPSGYRVTGRPARQAATLTLERDKPGHAFLESRQGNEGSNIALVWEGPACLLDNNVIAHWQALAKRWHGTPMRLTAIVPQDAAVADLIVEAATGAPSGGVALRAVLKRVEVRLLLDGSGELQSMSVPSRNLRAVRRGAPPDYVRAAGGGSA